MRPYIPKNVRALRKMLRNISVGMLTTQTPGGQTRSRPMLVHDVDDHGWMWFLTDRDSRKACDLVNNPYVSIAIQSRGGDRYVAVQGTAIIVKDDLQVRRLWRPAYRAWFPKGARDSEVALIAVRVSRAEYWLVPRTQLARVARTLKSIVISRRYQPGRHGVLDLNPMKA